MLSPTKNTDWKKPIKWKVSQPNKKSPLKPMKSRLKKSKLRSQQLRKRRKRKLSPWKILQLTMQPLPKRHLLIPNRQLL